MVPRQELIDPALLVGVDDGGKRSGQIGLRIDGIAFARFDQRGDGRPVLGSGIMTRKECVLPVEGNRPDGSLDAIVVDLDAAVGQEELQTIPIFGDIGQSLAERGLHRDAGAVMDEPRLNVGYEWR